MSIAGTMAAMGHTIAPDEIVKNSFANFAFENFEIAAYKSLLALADEGGDQDAVGLLERSLEEEMAMADWLDSNMEPLTLRYASLAAAGADAKR